MQRKINFYRFTHDLYLILLNLSRKPHLSFMRSFYILFNFSITVLVYIFKSTDFMSHQYEIKFMLESLKVMQNTLGGPNASNYDIIFREKLGWN